MNNTGDHTSSFARQHAREHGVARPTYWISAHPARHPTGPGAPHPPAGARSGVRPRRSGLGLSVLTGRWVGSPRAGGVSCRMSTDPLGRPGFSVLSCLLSSEGWGVIAGVVHWG